MVVSGLATYQHLIGLFKTNHKLPHSQKFWANQNSTHFATLLAREKPLLTKKLTPLTLFYIFFKIRLFG